MSAACFISIRLPLSLTFIWKERPIDLLVKVQCVFCFSLRGGELKREGRGHAHEKEEEMPR